VPSTGHKARQQDCSKNDAPMKNRSSDGSEQRTAPKGWRTETAKLRGPVYD
jgi:hypothetical protein